MAVLSCVPILINYPFSMVNKTPNEINLFYSWQSVSPKLATHEPRYQPMLHISISIRIKLYQHTYITVANQSSLVYCRNFSPDLKRRTCGGVRLLWNKGVTPSFLQRWLPASDAMPWLTFTYHPLAFSERGKDNTNYNVENFTQAVIDAIQQAYSKHTPGRTTPYSF